ncbi:MAG: CRTAC1 family protein [Myxococcota bacterium]
MAGRASFAITLLVCFSLSCDPGFTFQRATEDGSNPELPNPGAPDSEAPAEMCDDGSSCTGNDRLFGSRCIGDWVCPIFTLGSAPGLETLRPSAGIAWADYDEDGDLDVAIGHDTVEPSALYVNNQGLFEERELEREHRGLLWTDLDNDGDLDLWASDGSGSRADDARFYENVGAPDLVLNAGVSAALNGNNIACAAVFDENSDGWNDVVVFETDGPDNTPEDAESPTLHRSLAVTPLEFERVPADDAGLQTNGGSGEICAATDLNADGRIDLWFNEDGGGLFFVGQAGGGFAERASELGFEVPPIELDTRGFGFGGVRFADVNGDGLEDGFFGREAGSANMLYVSSTTTRFELSSELREDRGQTLGIDAGDIDHDGDLDFVIASQPPDLRLYLNDGAGRFESVSLNEFILSGAIPQIVSLVDIDGDGDLDLYASSDFGRSVLLENEVNDNKWLRVALRGQGPPASSLDAIGSRVSLIDASGQLVGVRRIGVPGGFGQQTALVAHFGLPATSGGSLGTYTIEVLFPSGRIARREVVPEDERELQIEEPEE